MYTPPVFSKTLYKSAAQYLSWVRRAPICIASIAQGSRCKRTWHKLGSVMVALALNLAASCRTAWDLRWFLKFHIYEVGIGDKSILKLHWPHLLLSPTCMQPAGMPHLRNVPTVLCFLHHEWRPKGVWWPQLVPKACPKLVYRAPLTDAPMKPWLGASDGRVLRPFWTRFAGSLQPLAAVLKI